MLPDIEDVAQMYYTQEMIDYDIYGVLVRLAIKKPSIIECRHFMPRFVFDKFNVYMKRALSVMSPTTEFIWETDLVLFAEITSFLLISEGLTRFKYDI